MTDQNFEIPVSNGAYSGSSRAKSAVKSASSGTPLTPNTSGTPTSDQTDTNIKDGGADMKQSDEPKVLITNTKPIEGGTPPNNVDPSGRPGMGASSWPSKNNRG